VCVCVCVSQLDDVARRCAWWLPLATGARGVFHSLVHVYRPILTDDIFILFVYFVHVLVKGGNAPAGRRRRWRFVGWCSNAWPRYGVGFVVAEYDKEDLGIFDFQLTPQERTQLAAL
jgi:hypothetical protein